MSVEAEGNGWLSCWSHCRGCEVTIIHDPSVYWDSLCPPCRENRRSVEDAKLCDRREHIHFECGGAHGMDTSHCYHPDMLDDLGTVLLRANGVAYDV